MILKSELHDMQIILNIKPNDDVKPVCLRTSRSFNRVTDGAISLTIIHSL